MDDKEKLAMQARIRGAFSPGAPIDRYTLFAGRTSQAKDVLNAISQRGHHVIVYGERGVGKTSLVNVLAEMIHEAGLDILSGGIVNCDGTDTFDSLWHKMLRETSFVSSAKRLGLVPAEEETEVRMDTLLPDRVAPDDVRFLLERLRTPSFFIIDELDRLKDESVSTLLSDTIKTLSDHSVPSTLILVGVADAVDQLIAEHASIERSLVQVRMPRMSLSELLEIVDKGLAAAAMTISDGARTWIAHLSQGLPHYTHLLALNAAVAAVQDGRTAINNQDVEAAIRTSVKNAQQTIQTAHHKATSSTRKTLYTEVLLACALAKTDALGYFAASDVRGPMSSIMRRPYNIPAFAAHLNAFCDPRRGPVLQKTGAARRFRFRFINPLMQPYVIMDGIARGLVSRAMVEGTSS